MSELPSKSSFPQELLDASRFILWFEDRRGDKLTKIPSAPWRTGHFGSASATDPENWVDFNTALKYAGKKEGYGIGFCFSKGDDIIGIDLDNCVNESGEVEDWALNIINSASSYTELSPSGKGIHILLRGEIPGAIKQSEEGIEAYDSGRFFTLTGRNLKGRKALRENQDLLNELWERYGEKPLEIKRKPREAPLDFSITRLFDLELLDGSKFRKSGNSLRGSHPIHGSTTGTNLAINPRENIWFCHRHECGGGALELLAILEGIIDCGSWDRGETPLKGEKWIRTVEAARRRGFITEEDGLKYLEKGKFVPKRLADEIMNNHDFLTMEDTEEIYLYDGGIYLPKGETMIRSESQARLGEYSKKHYKNEVVDFIKSATYIPRTVFDKDPHRIVVDNGVLNLKNGELEPHSPNPPTTVKIPVEYDPQAECPKIKKFLKEVLHEDDISTIREGIGYCLLKNYPISSAFMLRGAGANGKSTLLNLITRFLGEKNVATPSLQDLLQNRFAKAKLYGKLANIHADIAANKLEQTGAFKMLTGQDLIYAEKKYLSAFTYRNHAKLWFSCNELPYTSDRTPAFFERWILVDFPNRFPRDDPKTDPHIIEKITTEEELSGLLNWALEGLHNLLERGYFEKSRSREEVEGEWILQTDSLRAFVRFSCEQDPSSVIVKSDFYNAYLDFCNVNDLPTVQANTVGRRLPTIVPYVRSTQRTIKERREHCWEGITTERLKVPTQDTQVSLDSLEIQSSKDQNKKGIANNLCIPCSLCRDTASELRGKIRDLLLGMPLETKELLANFDKSDHDRVGEVFNKMAEEEEIFKDKNGRWRLVNE